MVRILKTVIVIVSAVGSLAPIFLQIDAIQSMLIGSTIGVLVLVVLVVCWLYNTATNLAQAEPAAFLRSGVTMVYPAASAATGDIANLTKKAEHSVKLLDTHFGWFDTIQASLGEAMEKHSDLVVQILVAEPAGLLAQARGAYRQDEIAVSVQSAHARIDAFRRQFDPGTDGSSSRVQVRSFDTTVSGPLVVIDDRHVFAGTYLQPTGSQNTPMLRMDRRPWWRFWSSAAVPDAYFRTFGELWGQHSETDKL